MDELQIEASLIFGGLKPLSKSKIFGWLVLKQRVLMMDNLLRRGWSGQNNCVFYFLESETVDHLFVSCEISRVVLKGLLPNKRALDTCDSVWLLMRESCVKAGALGRRELATIISVWWVIWYERYRKIFENKKRPPLG